MVFYFKYIKILFVLLSFSLQAQSTATIGANGKYLYTYEVIDSDTVLVDYYKDVIIVDSRSFKSKKEERRWSRLKRDVAIAYPYARMAGDRLKAYNDAMLTMDEADRKKTLKQAEQDLKAEFEPRLKKLTINQGRILIRLIDRQTGSSSYDLVKNLRGTFQAFTWQSVAQLFGHDLDSKYDPSTIEEDQSIERIINSIDNGTFSN